MTMEERKAKGLLWTDTGESAKARGLCYDFNHLRPEDTEKKMQFLSEILGHLGQNVWIEPPLTLAFGKTVSIGNNTYINFNLTLLDDYKITIGNSVLIAPNVISALQGILYTISCALTERRILLK